MILVAIRSTYFSYKTVRVDLQYLQAGAHIQVTITNMNLHVRVNSQFKELSDRAQCS